MKTHGAKQWFGVLLMAALLALSGGQVFAASHPDAAAKAALGWLTSRQQEDGSFPGFDAGASVDAIFAISAAGGDPNTVSRNNKSAVAYLETQASSFGTKSIAGAGKLALAAITAGKNPASFGGQNLIERISASYNTGTKLYGTNPTDHAYTVLALVSAGQPIADGAAQGFTSSQFADGGWSFDGTTASGSDTNTTGLAVQALAAAKIGGATLDKAIAYLKTQQNADGGFPYSKTSQYGSDSDANSTAAVIQAMTAAGIDARTLKQGANDPLNALVAFQNTSGALRYQLALPDDNDLATAQAIPALLLKPLPITATGSATTASQSLPLPATGSAPLPLWALVPALALLVLGAMLRGQRAR